jgi:hypothetical protein
MDCMMDEFDDEASIKSMNDRDICSWLEVKGMMSSLQDNTSALLVFITMFKFKP